MSNEPFRLRRADQIAGLFVLAIAGAVLAYAIYAGIAQGWFRPVERVRLALPPEGSMGLKRGSDVLVLGTSVGAVEDVSVDADGRMVARARVRADFLRFVREDSRAVVRQPLGLGDTYVDIARGTGAPLRKDGLLATVAERPPAAVLQETLEQFRSEALPALRELRTAVNEYAALAQALRDPQGDFQQTLAHAERLGASLSGSKSAAGRLLNDQQLGREVAAVLPRLSESLAQSQAILQDVRRATAELPQMMRTLGEETQRAPALVAEVQQTVGQMRIVLQSMEKSLAQLPRTVEGTNRVLDTLPGLMVQTQESLRQVERLTEAVQRSWLVRGYMDEAASGAPIRPERVGRRGVER
jgi:phospholipid/cholesterol/gamma-HCH transport system substrate-binding protein